MTYISTSTGCNGRTPCCTKETHFIAESRVEIPQIKMMCVRAFLFGRGAKGNIKIIYKAKIAPKLEETSFKLCQQIMAADAQEVRAWVPKPLLDATLATKESLATQQRQLQSYIQDKLGKKSEVKAFFDAASATCKDAAAKTAQISKLTKMATASSQQ